MQSVPILSFLPIVLLSLSAILPTPFAAELAAVVLIFTSQAWNMTFSFYQSMTTIPIELREAAAVFRFDPWTRFKTLELPFAAIGLLWNSMMSWSGGWFFLMAGEMFNVGDRDFRLPGLGSYLQTAANAADLSSVVLGMGALVLVIVLLDQFVWRPLTAWSDKFKVEMVQGNEPPSSWFHDLLSRAWLLEQFSVRVCRPFSEWTDNALSRCLGISKFLAEDRAVRGTRFLTQAGLATVLGALLLYGCYRAASLLLTLSASAWIELGKGLLATFLRVAGSLLIALLWTVPVGVAIGTNRRVAGMIQPLVQVVAAVPATALFPVLLLALLQARGGLNCAAIILMLMGTQWYPITASIDRPVLVLKTSILQGK